VRCAILDARGDILKFYQIDSFTDKVFGGNPAGVCLLGKKWISDDLMQKIAMENNLSETAFVVENDEDFAIRWFTPMVEVPLCGHATLAAAYVIFNHENHQKQEITFITGDKTLYVAKKGDLLTLDFPADKIWQIDPIDSVDCFNFKPVELWRGTDEYMLIFENEEQVRNAVCDLLKAAKIDLSGLIITAKADGLGSDFVSRYFTPKCGIDEDPVTGSTHTLLTPYWSRKLDKNRLTAAQVSARGGILHLENCGERIKISGKAVTYLVGEIFV